MSARRGACVLTLGQDTASHRIGIEAAVFDCDGLLMDSESAWLDTVEEWSRERSFPETGREDFLGLSVEDTVRRLVLTTAGAIDDEEAGALVTSLATVYSDRLAGAVPTMPGALDLVRTLSAYVPVAVASNGRRGDVERMLDQAGILPLVRTVCTVEDVARGKPAPDLYLEATRRLGVPPTNVVAFEDSPSGAMAATAAGLRVVGVNSDVTLALPADARLASLAEVAVHPLEKDR